MGRVSATTRTRSNIMPARLMGAGVLAGVLLSGCSGVSADQAAVIDGRAIDEGELQNTVAELNSVSPQPETPAGVLNVLVTSPILDTIVAGSPVELTDQQMSEMLTEGGLENASDLTIEVVRARQYQSILQDPATLGDPEMADALGRLQEVTVEDVASLEMDINPRYGTFDPETVSITQQAPGWIAPAG